MSGKVKVTEKIAKLIKNSLDKYPKHVIVEHYHSIAAKYREEMDLDTLIKALYIGYEIEEQYKVGDWVFVNNNGDEWVAKIATGTGVRDVFYVDECPYVDNKQYYHISKFRHATPEEIAKEKKRMFWVKLGREVDEYREGDIINHEGQYGSVIDCDMNNKKESITFECAPYVSKLNYVSARKILLVTPVEQRLDQ